MVAEYASVIPMLAVTSLFGISSDNGHQLRVGLIALFGSGENSQEGNRTFERILTEVMQSHKADPAEDLTTAFLRHHNLRDDGEVVHSIMLMISAGCDPPPRGSRRPSG